MSKFAWVTLTTNDTYSLGALVLAHSLRRTGTAHQLAVLITPNVSEAMRQRLQDVYNVVQEVNVLDSQDAANLALLARPELGVTFTKLHCWRLVQFEKCVFLDADTLVLQNVDELFEREELSAAPDVSWPDCFNSGVFVYRPSLETFAKIIEYAVTNGSFDGGDQGLLNSFFADWAHSDIKKHLPFIYNVAAFASYCYLPAFKQFRDKIKILHFAGKLKPWLIQFNSETRTALTPTEYAHAADLIQLWWNIFCDNVHQSLSNTMCDAILHYYYHYQQQQPAQNYHHYYENEHHHEQQYAEQQDHYQYHQHHQHHDHHEHHEHHHHEEPPPQSDEYGGVKEFHDPWQDYYEKLAREEHIQSAKESAEDQSEYFTIQSEEYPEQQDWPETASEAAPSAEWHEQEARQNEANYWNRVEARSVEETPQTQEQHQLDSQRRQEATKPIEQYQDKRTYDEAEQQQLQNAQSIADEAYEQSTKSHSSSGYFDDCYHIESCSTTTAQDNDYEAVFHNESTAAEVEEAEKDFSSIYTDDTIRDIVSIHSNKSTDKKKHVNEDEKKKESEKKHEDKNEAGLAGALSQLRLGEQRTPEQEAYEQLMRRQCWEAGQIDYMGKDSFDNIWKKIQETLTAKPGAPAAPPKDESEFLTSADIEDGKVIVDPVTKERTEYKVIDGGYEVKTITPQPNGTVKTSVRTFWDPKPVSAEDAKREAQNKAEVRKRFGKTIRIDSKTTMLTREIEGGYEEVYTITNEDGTVSSKTKTFFDSVPEDQLDKLNAVADKNLQKKKNQLVKKSSVDSTDSTESRRTVSRTDQQNANYKQHTTVEESRRVMETSEVTENNRTVRKNSVQEQNIRQVTSHSGGVDSSTKQDKQLKKKRSKSNIPPPPPDFIENDTTTVTSKRVPHGVEYTYSTQLESGKTVTTSTTVYEEEETELTEEEIQAYKKTLKDAEKHKNITTTKKLRSESGTKKVVPSDNPGEVTTVETIRIEGGTEYHYTTVCADGVVKKSVKTVYDPVQVEGSVENESEVVEEYEEEIIEPGDKNVRTIESVKKLPKKFEEVTVTEKHEKTEKKVKKSSMMISH